MKILIKNLQNRIPLYPVSIKRLIRDILKGERVKRTGCINLCFVNNALIKKFNLKFLKTNRPTDVLAFDFNEKKNKETLQADIMISTQTAITNARKFKTTPNYELMLYVTHGVLHLLGYDDLNKTKAKIMRKKETEYVDR
jgi:probable rRNA maturation factor